MKKLFCLTIVITSILSFSYGQNEIPNFVLAENSNFVVNIVSTYDYGTSRQITFLETVGGSKIERISPDQCESLSDGLFTEISYIIKEEFEKIGMHPAAFINFSQADTKDAEAMKKLSDQYMVYQPGFLVTIACQDWKKAEKAYAKNKLTADNIKPIRFTLGKIASQDVKDFFMVAKIGLSVATAMKEVKSAIDEKPESYFIKTMEISDEYFKDAEVNKELTDKMLKENEALEKFPDETELKANEILVVSPDRVDGMYYNHSLKQLEKFYPHKFKLISVIDYGEYLKKGYKYALVPKDYLAKKTSTKSGDGKTTSKTQTVTMYYYVLKDLKTLNVYYSNNKSKLEKTATTSPSWALKKALKIMQENYSWKE